MIDHKFNIIYQGKRYLWGELKQLCLSQPVLSQGVSKQAISKQTISKQGNSLSLSQLSSTQQVIFYPGDHHFESILCLLINEMQGGNNQNVFTPISSGLSDKDKMHITAKVSSSKLTHIRLAIASSGTLAKPKIILISQDNIFSHCQSFNQHIPLNHQSIWLNCLPLTHIAGIMIFYRCLYHNSCMLLHDNFNPPQVWQDIQDYKVTHISLVPIMLARLLDQSKDENGVDTFPVKSLKCVLIGGGMLSDQLYQRAIKANWPILISYGMTETTSTIAIGKSPDKLKILDGFKVKQAEQGQLKIKGAMVCAASTRDHSEENAWFDTHDIVELNENYLKVLGRDDHVIVSGGLNINPEYIEQLILSSEQVKSFISDLLITKQKHPLWGDTIVAIVVGSVKKLEVWVKENIKSQYQPRQFIQVDTIPRTAMGKINQAQLLKKQNLNH